MIVFITRHGETYHNTLGIIGGNSSLTANGIDYSKQIADYFSNKFPNKQLTVWTSSTERTKETSRYLNPFYIYKEFSELNEIYSGDFENLSLLEIQEKYPNEYNYRNSDKLNHAYPKGESYKDLYERISVFLDTNVDDIKTDILIIISHQATSRVLHSYMTEMSLEECIHMDIHLHTLYALE